MNSLRSTAVNIPTPSWMQGWEHIQGTSEADCRSWENEDPTLYADVNDVEMKDETLQFKLEEVFPPLTDHLNSFDVNQWLNENFTIPDNVEEAGEKTEQSLPDGRQAYLPVNKMSSDYAELMATEELKRLDQSLRATPESKVVRRRQLEFSRTAIVQFMLLAYGILLPGAQAVSSAEEYSNACCTLIWTIVCALVLYKFGKAISEAICLLTTAMCTLMGNLGLAILAVSNAVTLVSTSFAAVLNTVNGTIPVLVAEVKSYLMWMKIAHAVTAGCTFFDSLMTLFKIPFNAYSFFRGSSCGFVHESRQGVQKYNKYGVLLSALLAALMCIAIPTYGFAKATKWFEPIRRSLESLPYVTWLVDWIVGVCEGTAGTDDIPACVRAFQTGVEIPIGTSGYKYASGKDPDGDPTCDVGMCKRKDKCDDNTCFCRCHIAEEEIEAEESVASDDPREGTAGLGSKSQAVLRRNQMTFVKSVEETKESRVERLVNLALDPDAKLGSDALVAKMVPQKDLLAAIPQEEVVCERCQKDSKGRKMCYECYSMYTPDCVDEVTIGCTKIVTSTFEEKDKWEVPKQEKGKEKEEPKPDIIEENKQGKVLCPHCNSALIETEKEKCICCGGLLSEKRPEPTLIIEVAPTQADPWYSSLVRAYDERVKPAVALVQKHVTDNKTKYIAGACVVLGLIVTVATLLSKEKESEVLEGTGKHKSVRYTPNSRVRTRGVRGSKKTRHDHLVSGGGENEFEDDIQEREEERRQDLADRLADAYEEEREAEHNRQRVKHGAEVDECLHYPSCPSKLPIDVKNCCHTTCGGHHCTHWAGCKPEDTPEGMPSISHKQKQLKERWFPTQRDPSVIVARRRNAIRAAKVKEYSHPVAAEKTFERLAKKAVRYENPEALLGKKKLMYKDVAGRVFKMFHDDSMTSTATVIGDKVVVPLHSHVDTDNLKIANWITSAKLRGEVVPIADDLGIYFHGGVVKPQTAILRPPRAEMVMMLGYTDPEQVEPGCGVGFASPDGLYNAPTLPGDCGGPVVSCEDGAIVGFHIAGSTGVNRFVPVTEEMVKKLKATKPVLASMLFH